MGKVTLEATGGYAWPPLPAPSFWERLGGWGARRREQRARRERERRDWLLAVHAAAVLEEALWVTRARLVVDQTEQQLRYEVYRGVLALRGQLPLGEVVDWQAPDWRAWLDGLMGRPSALP